MIIFDSSPKIRCISWHFCCTHYSTVQKFWLLKYHIILQKETAGFRRRFSRFELLEKERAIFGPEIPDAAVGLRNSGGLRAFWWAFLL